MIKFLFEWQTLIGAIIAAGVPLSLVIIGRWVFDRIDHLSLLEKLLVLSINNLSEVYKTSRTFSETKLNGLIEGTRRVDQHNSYSVGVAFFPLFVVTTWPEDILSKSTWSGFIENMKIELFMKSHDFKEMINDARRQFENVLQLQRDLAFGEKTEIHLLNQRHIKDIEKYKDFLNKELLDGSIPVYLKRMITGLVALKEYRSMGHLRWTLKFNGSFIAFKSNKDYDNYIKEASSRVQTYIQPIVEKEYERIYSFIRSEQ